MRINIKAEYLILLFSFILISPNAFSESDFPYVLKRSQCEDSLIRSGFLEKKLLSKAVLFNFESELGKKVEAFIKENPARPDQLMELAEKAFLLRLEWSRTHDLRFFEHASELWRPRLSGQPGHGVLTRPIDPILSQVHKIFNIFSPFERAREIESWGIVRVRNFKSPLDVYFSQTYFFAAKKLGFMKFLDRYYFVHASSEHVPMIIEKELEPRWERILNAELSMKDRVQALAEFEWLYYWTNPFGRSGAFTGKILSILLQIEMGQNSTTLFQMDSNFHRYDQIALMTDLDDYRLLRRHELLRSPEAPKIPYFDK